MVVRKIFKSLFFRSLLNRKSLFRKQNGEIGITLKVAKHGFFEKLILYNFQSFKFWQNSSHFNDIFGKYRFNMNDDRPQHPGEDLSPPKQVEGMKVLDRSKFKKRCKIPGIKIPHKSVRFVSKKMKSSMLKMPKLKSIAELDDDDEDNKSHKLLLLNPENYMSVHNFSDDQKQIFKENEVDIDSFHQYDFELCYDNWTAPEVLRAVIPDPTVSVSGFSIIGHIAHLNLKKEAMEYKNIIGEVLIDKNPVIKTVVNKTNEIDNTFRNFKMELLAGENNMVTQARENGFTYQFDFSKVYWNPRLSTEHQRVITEINKGDVIYDVFAGVGPFAIPAAKMKKAVVYANDLNPNSYESLCKNIDLNKVKTEIKCSNLDGREFIRSVVKPDLLQRWTTCKETETETNFKVVMNLPALAIEFTDAFQSLFEDIDEENKPTSKNLLPYLYVYCFTKSEAPEADVKQRIETSIGSALPDSHIIRYVRNVAPNKDMLCICFHMPEEVMFRKKVVNDENPVEKKRKLDDG